MVTTPSTDADAFQDLAELRDRIDYRGSDFFDDNAQLRFDKLLVRLERESRGVFTTLWGDVTLTEETGKVQEKRATGDSAMLLEYPVQDVTKVEIKRTLSADWDTLDADRYDHTDHRLILANRERHNVRGRSNSLTDATLRAEWSDLAAKVRVTYDRGFNPVPSDVKSLQVQLVNQMCRKLKREQTTAAASPDELAGMSEMNEVVTDEIRRRINDVTKPGGATMSV